MTDGRFSLLPQQGEGLSERLSGLFASGLAGGYGAVAIIDSDSPDLPRSLVMESFRVLRRGVDVVFGPCRDGGYYLVGMRQEHPEIFVDIPWSTSGVLRESLDRAESLGLKTALLPPWQDIDTFEDLRAFYCRWQHGPFRESGPGRETVSFLSGLLECGGLDFDQR